MAVTEEPHEVVPEDLKKVLLALPQEDARYSSMLVVRCVPALIFVARHEPDLFPKRFARAIVYGLEPVQLWTIACNVDGLDVEGIDVARITNDCSGRDYMWESLDARTRNATDVFIAPQVFSMILNAYEEQEVERERLDTDRTP
jgi:hypothetical protein